MMKRFFVSFSCCLFLSSCSWLTLEQQPSDYVPCQKEVEWRHPETPCAQAVFEEAICFDSTQRVDLCYLLDYALSHHPETQKSYASAKGSYYAMKGKQSAYYPQIDATIGLSTINNNFGSGAGSNSLDPVDSGDELNTIATKANVFSTEFTLSYLLLDFGGRRGEVQAAKYALFSANWTHNKTLQKVLFDVIKSYYEALSAVEERMAKEKDLESALESLQAAKVQFTAGVVNKLDLLQTQTTALQREVALQEALGKEVVSFATLAKAAGLPANTPLNIEPIETLPQVSVTKTVEEMMEIALVERADLAALFASYQEQTEQITVAKSKLYPELHAIVDLADYGFDGGGLGHAKSYVAGINLTWNLFNGFEDEYNIYLSKTKQEEALCSWQLQERQVMLDVVSGYSDYQTANQTLGSTQSYLNYSEQAFNAALIGYKAGTTEILDVLQTQSQLAEARAKYIQARSNWLIALANLSYATGTLFQQGEELCASVR